VEVELSFFTSLTLELLFELLPPVAEFGTTEGCSFSFGLNFLLLASFLVPSLESSFEPLLLLLLEEPRSLSFLVSLDVPNLSGNVGDSDEQLRLRLFDLLEDLLSFDL
jgi:hypothetical protein